MSFTPLINCSDHRAESGTFVKRPSTADGEAHWSEKEPAPEILTYSIIVSSSVSAMKGMVKSVGDDDTSLNEKDPTVAENSSSAMALRVYEPVSSGQI